MLAKLLKMQVLEDDDELAGDSTANKVQVDIDSTSRKETEEKKANKTKTSWEENLPQRENLSSMSKRKVKVCRGKAADVPNRKGRRTAGSMGISTAWGR